MTTLRCKSWNTLCRVTTVRWKFPLWQRNKMTCQRVLILFHFSWAFSIFSNNFYNQFWTLPLNRRLPSDDHYGIPCIHTGLRLHDGDFGRDNGARWPTGAYIVFYKHISIYKQTLIHLLTFTGDYPQMTIMEYPLQGYDCTMEISAVTTEQDGLPTGAYIVPFFMGVPGSPVAKDSVNANTVRYMGIWLISVFKF